VRGYVVDGESGLLVKDIERDLPADERVVAKLVGWLDALVASGAQRTVEAAIARA